MKNAQRVFRNKSLKKIGNILKPWFSLIFIVLFSLVIYAAYIYDRGYTIPAKTKTQATLNSKLINILRLTPSQTGKAINVTPSQTDKSNPILITQTQIPSSNKTGSQPTQLSNISAPILTLQPNSTQTALPLYIATLVDLLGQVTGDWQGIATTKVNKEERQNQPVILSIQRGCTVGSICGKYHFDSPCFGNLILKQLKGMTLIFSGQDLSRDPKCQNGGIFYIKPQNDGDLSLSVVLIDSEGRITVHSTTLELVH